ncbi:MAG: glycoside hydrolase family 3 C-terminal domain-containing protein, partial [Bacteroidales bacterium]|nr:glycoside hydrolase family 3 C-terminal domain-containing protein [Bacteroidales bacterium]
LLPETENCDAILQVWYLGEKGGDAIAEVITGKTNPSGKLPVTFYKDVNQIPDFLNYTMKNRTYRYMTENPLFEFGYGLSYSDFKISKVKYENKKLSYQIKNSSKTDGDEVVQIYIRKIGDTDGPNKTLRKIQRISVPAGKTIKSEIELSDKTFEWWDKSTNTMRTVPGEYEIMIGNSSNTTLSQKVTID